MATLILAYVAKENKIDKKYSNPYKAEKPKPFVFLPLPMVLMMLTILYCCNNMGVLAKYKMVRGRLITAVYTVFCFNGHRFI